MFIKIPLKQHVGLHCKPIVKLDEEVKKGQLLAIPNGLGANIHSSVYGIVKDITNNDMTIELHIDQPEEYVRIKETKSHIEAIKEAGIVGSGGAGFPAHIKLNVDLKGGYVIVNAAECEPTLSHNILVIEEQPELILRGLKYAMKITNASKGYIAIKPKHKKAIITLGKVCKNESNIEIKFLPDMYPAGDERVIIRELLKVELKPGQLPSEANALVSNVETMKNICLAIEERRPVITKDITVGGRVGESKVFLDAPIGYPVSHFIEKCGGYEKPYGEIVIGGPFTGKRGQEETSITKTTGGILVAMPFPEEKRKAGIIACECGAQEERLREIAAGMGTVVVAEAKCKRMTENNGRYRCDLPGICPGQAEKVLALKKQGAEIIITGTCEDWTNTVIGTAPRLGVPVYHSTDHVLRASGHKLYRKKQ